MSDDLDRDPVVALKQLESRAVAWARALPPEQQTALYIKSELWRVESWQRMWRNLAVSLFILGAFYLASVGLARVVEPPRDDNMWIASLMAVVPGLASVVMMLRARARLRFLHAGRAALRASWPAGPTKQMEVDADGEIHPTERPAERPS